jgi:hypothetical protein
MDLLSGRQQFADLARHSLLADGELVGIPRHPFLAGCEFVDVPRRLLLSDGDPVNDLPHSVEINRHGVEPLLIELSSLRRYGRAVSAIRCGLRRQPANP